MNGKPVTKYEDGILHEGILAFGWGGKKKNASSAIRPTPEPNKPKIKKVTVYQVVKNGEVVAEYPDPASARQKAVEVVGRIQITAKNIEVT